MIHAVAFALRDELKGRFIETSRAGVSDRPRRQRVLAGGDRASRRALDGPGGSLLTLTYFGAEKVLPHYNAMGIAKAALEACVRYLAFDLGPQGIRVNAISAGPLRTLSSAGITGFKTMLHHHAERAPLGRNITPEEVAQTAVYLCSAMGSGVTGEVCTSTPATTSSACNAADSLPSRRAGGPELLGHRDSGLRRGFLRNAQRPAAPR